MTDFKDASSNEVTSNEEKIRSLQEMIANAEQTISSARDVLSQIQGGIPSLPRPGLAETSVPNGKVILGNFDGQIMLGEDGKQYPVPANYASKSKLIEGDQLKLTITADGSFVYKQIGPNERRYLIGIVEKDERGNFVINAESKKYKVLLAAATYFKIELGDEVTIVIPRLGNPVWSAVENIVRKAGEVVVPITPNPYIAPVFVYQPKAELSALPEKPKEEKAKPVAIARLEKEMEEERKRGLSQSALIDEWTPDIEALKKEASYPVRADMQN